MGLRSTRMTLSPRRNILEMKRSRFTGRDPFLPRPDLGICAIECARDVRCGVRGLAREG